MTYGIVNGPAYARAAKRLFRRHPKLRERYVTILERLVQDPFDLGFRAHPLKGELVGRWAIRLTYSLRIILAIDARSLH